LLIVGAAKNPTNTPNQKGKCTKNANTSIC
jgi:hypothetical protein